MSFNFLVQHAMQTVRNNRSVVNTKIRVPVHSIHVFFFCVFAPQLRLFYQSQELLCVTITTMRSDTLVWLFVVSSFCLFEFVWFSWSHDFNSDIFLLEIVDCTQVSMKMPRTTQQTERSVCMQLCVWYWRTRARRHLPPQKMCSLAHFAPPRIPYNCPTISLQT